MKLIQKIKLKVKKTFHNDPNKQCSNVTTSPLSWRGAGGEAFILRSKILQVLSLCCLDIGMVCGALSLGMANKDVDTLLE